MNVIGVKNPYGLIQKAGRRKINKNKKSNKSKKTNKTNKNKKTRKNK